MIFQEKTGAGYGQSGCFASFAPLVLFTIFTIFTILGGPVIGNLPRGLPKRCRCVRNLILEILEILEILLMIYTITSLLSTLPDSLDIALPLG